jgi:hypothetical protein
MASGKEIVIKNERKKMKVILPAGTRSSMKLEESTRFCSKIVLKTHYKQFGGSLWF